MISPKNVLLFFDRHPEHADQADRLRPKLNAMVAEGEMFSASKPQFELQLGEPMPDDFYMEVTLDPAQQRLLQTEGCAFG